MARPKKPAGERMDTDIRIPVTQAQKDSIQAAAMSAGRDMAAWAREILMRNAVRTKSTARSKKG